MMLKVVRDANISVYIGLKIRHENTDYSFAKTQFASRCTSAKFEHIYN